MEFIKKHSNKILIAAAAAALVFGGCHLLHLKRSHPVEPLNPKSEPYINISHVFVKDDKYYMVIDKLKPIVRSELQVGDLSKQTIITINQAVIHVFRADYARLMLEGRRIRRKFMDNLDLYAKEFIKNAGDAEKLMENASLEVLKDLDISMETYENSSERIMQSDPNFAMFNLYMFESLKTQLPSERTKVLTKPELLAILSFQCENYNNVDFSSLNLGPEQLIMIKQAYVSDKASMDLDYEEEDIMKNPALLQDPEIMDAQRQLQNVMLNDQANMTYYD